MTPAPIRSGETQPRSNDRTWAAMVVPMSAPSMMAKAIDSGIRPRPAKEETRSDVAVLGNDPYAMPDLEEFEVRRREAIRQSRALPVKD